MPIAYVKSSEPPVTTLPDVETNKRSPARNGPVHGAAISPPTRPIANAPPEALAADLIEPLLDRRWQAELEHAEHRQRERDEQKDERDHDVRARQLRAEVRALAEQREGHAERGIRDGPCRRRRRSRAAIARFLRHVFAARAEDRERDRDHRVDARGQRRQEPDAERRRGTSTGSRALGIRRSCRHQRSRSPARARRTRGASQGVMRRMRRLLLRQVDEGLRRACPRRPVRSRSARSGRRPSDRSRTSTACGRGRTP